VPCAEINVRDPFVVPDSANRLYRLYMSQPWSGGDGVSLRTSPDLENWSEPKPVLDIPEEVKKTVTAYWAPEMHAYGGKYYVFVTLLRTGKRKGTWIFRSDSPEGPFRPLQLRATTPEDWEALDGTLYVEDGKRAEGMLAADRNDGVHAREHAEVALAEAAFLRVGVEHAVVEEPFGGTVEVVVAQVLRRVDVPRVLLGIAAPGAVEDQLDLRCLAWTAFAISS